MEAGTVERDRSRSHTRSRPSSYSQFSFEKELITAKTSKAKIDLVLAADFACSDGHVFSAEDTIAAIVEAVDTYSVKFLIRDRSVWINKAFIAGVWM